MCKEKIGLCVGSQLSRVLVGLEMKTEGLFMDFFFNGFSPLIQMASLDIEELVENVR